MQNIVKTEVVSILIFNTWLLVEISFNFAIKPYIFVGMLPISTHYQILKE